MKVEKISDERDLSQGYYSLDKFERHQFAICCYSVYGRYYSSEELAKGFDMLKPSTKTDILTFGIANTSQKILRDLKEIQSHE